MKADREYKKTQTRIIQSVENRKAKVAVLQGADRNNTTTAQLFAIPKGLHDIIFDVTNVQNDIKTTGSTATPLYGSEEWARDICVCIFAVIHWRSLANSSWIFCQSASLTCTDTFNFMGAFSKNLSMC